MNRSEQTNELNAALSAAQGEFPAIAKNKEAKVRTQSGPGFSYRYADIADVLHAVLPVLSKHKLCLTQPTVVEGSVLILKTHLAHASGQWIESDYPVCSVNGDHQKMGAALTYARRYSLCSLVGVAADDDMDGQEAAEPQAKPRPQPAAPQLKPVPKPVREAGSPSDLVFIIRETKDERELQAVTTSPHNIKVFEGGTPEEMEAVSNAIAGQRSGFDYASKSRGM